MERIYKYAFQFFKMGYASALSWVLFVIILMITVIQWRLQKRWVFYDG
jgi:multiple sugar transport system permease protein